MGIRKHAERGEDWMNASQSGGEDYVPGFSRTAGIDDTSDSALFGDLGVSGIQYHNPRDGSVHDVHEFLCRPDESRSTVIVTDRVGSVVRSYVTNVAEEAAKVVVAKFLYEHHEDDLRRTGKWDQAIALGNNQIDLGFSFDDIMASIAETLGLSEDQAEAVIAEISYDGESFYTPSTMDAVAITPDDLIMESTHDIHVTRAISEDDTVRTTGEFDVVCMGENPRRAEITFPDRTYVAISRADDEGWEIVVGRPGFPPVVDGANDLNPATATALIEELYAIAQDSADDILPESIGDAVEAAMQQLER